MKRFERISLQQLPETAARLQQAAGKKRIWAFHGEMGAGKTTLIKAICAHAGVTDEVSSPTFSLVNEYETKTGERIYHFDFYRIKNVEEAYDIGYEEYFDSGNLCLIEWPEKIEPLLTDEAVMHIKLMKIDENTREITVH